MSVAKSFTKLFMDKTPIEKCLWVAGCFSSTCATLSVLPVPRTGFLSAFTLHLFRSPAPNTTSSRTEDLATFKKTLDNLEAGDYLVVQGSKGVGKTCFIRTALAGQRGVVEVDVYPDSTCAAVTRAVFQKIARTQYSDPEPSAERVLHWCEWFNKQPVVVLHVAEVRESQKHAQMTATVRILAAKGIRVVVDASENSLEDGVLWTKRQKVLPVGLMTKAQILRDPVFGPFLKDLEQDPLLLKVVETAVGYHPKGLQNLIEARRTDDDPRLATVRFLKQTVNEARLLLAVAKDTQNGEIKALLKKLGTAEAVDMEFLKTRAGLKEAQELRAFRQTQQGCNSVITPATPAVAMFLRRPEAADLTYTLAPAALAEALPRLAALCDARPTSPDNLCSLWRSTRAK
eukprot:NODE_1863_length_1355_cov_103.788274_g1763_i1.p1 GENE.NODE_1863_length_1355_cov_103.788274_g1763_i1~~NODE_1863_length_1355_cov_103.788274_g1763_i1.p1  ORF type:complete len:422 (-),score=95.05 NODE_1863_length_1355_cov_103.788274_g1763_i1:90-1292(-)